MRRIFLFASLTALTMATEAVRAQGPFARPASGRQTSQDMPPLRRQRLEQQLRRGLWRAAKTRVGLTDDQMARLEQTSQRFDRDRRALAQEERSQRLALRAEILADDKADQTRVAAALDRLLALQRQRLDLHAAEQRELSTFMTPMQRAKYAALQEGVRRRLEALRRQRPDTMSGPSAP